SGLLKQYGIQPKMEALASASITQALIGGSIDIAYASSVTIPTAVEKGAKLVVLGASYQGPIFSVVGNPSIKGLAGLKGKKLGTTQVGSTTYVLAEQLIQSVGLKPNKDVTLVPVGSNAASIAALKSGELDAAVLSEPATTQAIDSGASMIYNQADSGVKSVGWVISVRRAYLSANKDTITKFLKADIATVHFMKAEPDKAAPLLSGLLDTSDPSVLSGSLAAMNRITENALQIPTDDYTAKIAVAAASDPGLKNLELSSFVDTSLVDQIVASGFVQSLGPDPSSSAAAPSAPAASPSAP
ncbi:MAG TPA: ABC transporter substrate-binding protein, partial [Micromonosporaceae bacterium]